MKTYTYDLEDRLAAFAVMILDASERIESGIGGRNLVKQIVRSGTSPALNYGEAQGAESSKDFLHKMKVCLKELRETQICLKIIRMKPYLPSNVIDPIYDECNQLIAIFVTSIETKRRNMGVQSRSKSE